MAWVDLNPVLAKIVGSLGKSKNTGIRLRMKKIAKNQALASNFSAPIAGLATCQRPKLSEAEYIEFVDQTTRGQRLKWQIAGYVYFPLSAWSYVRKRRRIKYFCSGST